METTKKKMTFKQAGCLFAILAPIVFLIVTGVLVSNSQNKKDWKAMNLSEKEEWLTDFIKSSSKSSLQLEVMMKQEITKKFAYPKEVEFEGYPTLQGASVVLADSAIVVVAGTGTAKNTFGVKSGFRYQCILTINPNKLRLEKVTISETE